ncbi:MAG: hypothetical protein HOO06_11505 [Bdellovibrionaceae bacterium]|jgi:hypothetical protein|nr:hypothetical protein [Pseudobdellovibrionaceae bacterium]
MNKKLYFSFILISVLVMLTRFLPMPANFSPLFGWAIFSGAYFSKNQWLLILPMILLIVFDSMVGIHASAYVVWFCFLAISMMSRLVVKKDKIKLVNLAVMSGSAPLFFFLVTNFEVWLNMGLYPKNMGGLLSSYVAALPFYHMSLLSSALFTVVFFGSWAYLKKFKVMPEKSFSIR